MLVLRSAGAGAYTVVGSDSETLPSPIPANHISSFPLATPILVQAGDVLGLALAGTSETACLYEGAAGDTVGAGHSGALTPGSSLLAISSVPNDRLNVAGELTQVVDLSLAQSVTPATGGPGVALITLTPGGPGPLGVPSTVSDIVPAGLTILGAGVSGSGSCSVAGQTVTCSLASLPASAGAAIDIVVSSAAPGTYTNQALITPAIPDSNPANNTASGTLTVTAPNPPATCTVISLKGATLASRRPR